MITSLVHMIRTRTWWRIREIMIDAPWSNFDLLASLIAMLIGGYLLLRQDLFAHVGGVYGAMAQIGPEWAWGLLFLGLGVAGLMTVLWCVCPPFLWRLLARMGTAFCLLTFAFNNLSYLPPPLSSITYGLLSAWAIWGILRTKYSGR